METEFFQWGQLVIGAVGLVFSGVGLGCIVWGLFSMKAAGRRRDREIDEMAAAGKRRDREIDAMAAAFSQQAETLGKIGEGITELLRRSGPA